MNYNDLVKIRDKPKAIAKVNPKNVTSNPISANVYKLYIKLTDQWQNRQDLISVTGLGNGTIDRCVLKLLTKKKIVTRIIRAGKKRTKQIKLVTSD